MIYADISVTGKIIGLLEKCVEKILAPYDTMRT